MDLPVLRIRIHWIRIQHSKGIQIRLRTRFRLIKNLKEAFLKDVQATGEAFIQPSKKRTYSTSKDEIYPLFSIFLGHFCPLESGSRDPDLNPEAIRIRIRNTGTSTVLSTLRKYCENRATSKAKKKTRLEETLHHATWHESLSPRLIAGQMVEEGEEGCCQWLREAAAAATAAVAAVGGGWGETGDAVAHHDG